ncbi:hypothetical protein HPB48_002184 [Haemaphysalis longicornis]|uniref:Uncharacterized protein n=1 Tax=Haemaphysalis longicornis TaxID=44386 RepID=A0A9J6F7Q6_HAELO|nr:hypothetical protein HPB48_002184 [Haemaphysalis longicornis]
MIGCVKHPTICYACFKRCIGGTRWKRTLCHATEICNSCYMLDKHDLDLAFAHYMTRLQGRSCPRGNGRSRFRHGVPSLAPWLSVDLTRSGAPGWRCLPTGYGHPRLGDGGGESVASVLSSSG